VTTPGRYLSFVPASAHNHLASISISSTSSSSRGWGCGRQRLTRLVEVDGVVVGDLVEEAEQPHLVRAESPERMSSIVTAVEVSVASTSRCRKCRPLESRRASSRPILDAGAPRLPAARPPSRLDPHRPPAYIRAAVILEFAARGRSRLPLAACWSLLPAARPVRSGREVAWSLCVWLPTQPRRRSRSEPADFSLFP
jgi:hypothetical protein